MSTSHGKKRRKKDLSINIKHFIPTEHESVLTVELDTASI
jgi:hypothetical protein